MSTLSIWRPFAVALITVASISLSGCKGENLDFRNAQINNGKVYAGDANEPFSGTLTNLPAAQLLNSQPGFQQIANAISNTGALIPASARALQSFGGVSNAAMILPAALCTVSIKDGAPNGDASCTAPQSDTVRIKANFSAAALSGDFMLYDAAGSQKLVTVSFVDGKPDGTMEIHSPNTGKLVHSTSWNKGVLNGDDKGFDEQTGNQVLQMTMIDGRIDGQVTHYAPDGKQVTYKSQFESGVQEGKEETFDPSSGTLTGQAEYIHGKLQDTVKRWKPDGTLIYEKHYDAGRELPVSDQVKACVAQRREAIGNIEGLGIDAENEWEAQCEQTREQGGKASDANPVAQSVSTPVSDNPVCVNAWIAAFHHEKGDEATVSPDQIEEWRTWCAQGKHPD